MGISRKKISKQRGNTWNYKSCGTIICAIYVSPLKHILINGIFYYIKPPNISKTYSLIFMSSYNINWNQLLAHQKSENLDLAHSKKHLPTPVPVACRVIFSNVNQWTVTNINWQRPHRKWVTHQLFHAFPNNGIKINCKNFWQNQSQNESQQCC